MCVQVAVCIPQSLLMPVGWLVSSSIMRASFEFEHFIRCVVSIAAVTNWLMCGSNYCNQDPMPLMSSLVFFTPFKNMCFCRASFLPALSFFSVFLFLNSAPCRCFFVYHCSMNNHVHRALLHDRKEKERQKEKNSNKVINIIIIIKAINKLNRIHK